MNGLDWAAAVLVAAGLVLGFSRGLIAQLVSFLGLFIGYVAAFMLYDEVAPVLKEAMALSNTETYKKYEFLAKTLQLDTYVYNAISFAIILFGVKLALSIAGRFLNLLAAAPGLKQVNKGSGAVLGVIEAALIVIVAVHVMTVIPNDTAQRLLKESVAAPYLLENIPIVSDKLQELWENRSVDKVKA
jgi:uncharacterized membrane protein required for colicin V production